MEPPIWQEQPGESPLDALHREYVEQGHPWFLAYAVKLCHEQELPPPWWIVEAIEKTLSGKADSRPYQGGRSPSEQARQDKIDYIRALVVDMLRANDVPSREVYQAAADELSGNPPFEGGDSAIRNSYRRVKAKRKG